MLMAKTVIRHLVTLLRVTAPLEAFGMMSSKCADPHQGSGWVFSPFVEAGYMAATVSLSHPSTPLLQGWVHI